jgi:hypothetical protein
MTKQDRTRMLSWLLLSFLLYALALMISQPVQVQTLLWKAGHVTVAAHLGYWVDRHAFGRVTAGDSDTRRMARAIVIAGAMLAMSMGL